MPRMISIFSNIKDVKGVLKLYEEVINPILFSHPGVSRVDVHKLSYLSPEYPEELGNIQIIFETFFESYESLTRLLNAPQGKKIMRIMAENDIGDYYLYWSEMKDIRKEHYYPEKVEEPFPNLNDLSESLETKRKLIEAQGSDFRKERLLNAVHDLQTELNLLKLKEGD